MPGLCCSFNGGLYPGLFGNPQCSENRSLPKETGNAGPAFGGRDGQCTPACPDASKSRAAKDPELGGRPRAPGQPCGEVHRLIPEPPLHKGHSSASRSSRPGWNRLRRGAFWRSGCAPQVTRAPLRLRAPRPWGRVWSAPRHGPVAAGASQTLGASGRLGGTGAGALAAPGSRRAPRGAARTPGGRGRLGVGTGRGRGSRSGFRRPSSRLPRTLSPAGPARSPAGPFTFKQLAVEAAPRARRGLGRRALPPARPRLAGPGAGTRSQGRGLRATLPPARVQGQPFPGLGGGPGRGEWARACLSEGWRGWRRRPSQRAALSEYGDEPGGVVGHTGNPGR